LDFRIVAELPRESMHALRGPARDCPRECRETGTPVFNRLGRLIRIWWTD
jgi:hypothetical protein